MQYEIPSGPPSVIPRAPQNTHAAYLAWRKTPEGAQAWEAIQVIVLDRYRAGAQRIAINAVVELVRGTLKAKINNTWRAWISDDLVVRYPYLNDVIERRRRKARAA